MAGNMFTINLPSSKLGIVASILAEDFLTFCGVLVACVSFKYANKSGNVAALYGFIVALFVAFLAVKKIKLASENARELPMTLNDTTRPISNTITTSIFLISIVLGKSCLIYILHPSLVPVFLFLVLLFFANEIPYQKVIECFGGVSSRVFSMRDSFQQIFLSPQQGEAAPQAFKDTPATEV